MILRKVLVLGATLSVVTACSSAPDALDTESAGAGSDQSALSGCAGHASSSVPSSGNYYLTSFGGGSDTQRMSCGGVANGAWYYAASRQRFGCGSRIRIEANGKCVVAETDDYGPDVCVENAAGRPIIDASPLVAKALFGTSSAGWSDHFAVHATLVARSTPLGPCAPPPPPPPPDVAPRGYLDSATCTTIAGWAQDPDKPTAAIGVTITFDGPATKAGVTKLAATANLSRPDLCAALGSCNHAFGAKLPAALADGKSHAIYAYGVDTTGAKTTLLTNAPKTVTCAPPPSPDAGGPAGPDASAPTGAGSQDPDAGGAPSAPAPKGDEPTDPAVAPAPSADPAPEATGPVAGSDSGCAAAPGAPSSGRSSLLLAGFALLLVARSRRRR